MVHAVRDNDIVARYGRDEFIIILPNCQSNTDTEMIASRLLQEICIPIDIAAVNVKLSSSIGIAFYPEDANTSEDLISLANKAIYEAKHAGKN